MCVFLFIKLQVIDTIDMCYNEHNFTHSSFGNDTRDTDLKIQIFTLVQIYMYIKESVGFLLIYSCKNRVTRAVSFIFLFCLCLFVIRFN